MKKAILDLAKDTYPSECFFDFSTGVKISNDDINKWICEGLEHIRTDVLLSYPQKTFASISSGNTLVFIEAYRQDESSYLYTIFINVATSYSHSSYIDIECI